MVLAYLDPGAGSMLIQALLAGVLAVPFLLRSRLAQVVRRFRHAEPQENASTNDGK